MTARPDKLTIKHIDRNTEETKYYNLSQINNFIKNYEGRVRESKEKRKLKTMQSRQKTLDYWISRSEELLNKMTA